MFLDICNSDDLIVEGISLENSQQYIETTIIRCAHKQRRKQRVVITLIFMPEQYIWLGNHYFLSAHVFIRHTYFCCVIIFVREIIAQNLNVNRKYRKQ